MSQLAAKVSKRLFSLDVFRGLTMFLLIAEAAGFHHNFSELAEGMIFSGIAHQLHHHPWNGLRFWDLIQPFFMFIVGVAMPFSLRKRLATGNRSAATKHILRRCFLLFAFGVLLHCVYSHAVVWELWNVLVQLAFTILIAYAIMNLPHKFQIAISIGLLALTELLYRMYNPDAPYAQGHESFGSYVDMLVMGLENDGYWVFINFIPTAAHTIWGVICGQILLSNTPAKDKIKPFLIWGTVILILGFALDLLNITPIIKRIATSSFTLSSGGFAILTLTLFYWLIDVKNNKNKWLKIFSVVGTNSIFIYLFSETVGVQWFRDFGKIWTAGLFSPLGLSENLIMVINSLFVLFIFWYITYFLDKHKVYFKV
ncbi:acyltransferase family protein [Maribacter sp. 2308TA10-17]|uniref:acyltransferase family protein n=1 Tax=Maribacter sp. 2308TA10-17 TaxID=3386276 RepID=UPI0039BC3BC3